MPITIESLREKRAQCHQQHCAHLQAAEQASGAVQVLDALIAELEQQEADSELRPDG